MPLRERADARMDGMERAMEQILSSLRFNG